MELKEFIESNLNNYAQKIIDRGEQTDEMALGELTFYMLLRRMINGTATKQDLGTVDAINDTLQHLGRLPKGETFYK